MQDKLKKTLIALAVVAGASFITVADAQPPGRQGPRTETPRLPDGTVDLAGDGVWNLPWVRDLAENGMADYENIDSVPFQPWARAMFDYNQGNLQKYDPEGFCLPPGGPRSMATPYPAEIIQNRDRIIIIFEGGGHVWREIHMDGREHPEDISASYFGHSTGHWEGDTLVVDTVGYNEKSWIDYAGHMHTDQLHTIERITRPFKEVLHYEVTINDPGAYTAPWVSEWDIPWSDGQELMDYVCQENNKFLLDMHDDTGAPFFGRTEGVE